MTWNDFGKVMDAVGVPHVYNSFKQPTKLPFMAYLTEREPDFMADNIHYLPMTDGILELYTNKKDFALEGRIKALLTQNKIPYRFEMENIDSHEGFHVTRWGIFFIGG